MITIPVEPGGRRYEVIIGDAASSRLKEIVAVLGASRAVIVTQDAVGHDVESGVPQTTVTIGPGEEAKSLDTISELCRAFSRDNLTRRDVVVAVGGGVVTDTAGFAAASYHRGTAVVHVPTTLLAQVDAAIGGKTGVNLPEGKNLVGAFWQPAAVLCDTAALASLPRREWRSGLGEVVKCELLGAAVAAASPTEEMVAACVRLKAAIVSDDERETSGRRDLLNYGHTLAHALETVGGYDLRHGEAVAIGLAFAARLARRLGRIPEEREREIVATILGYSLPVACPLGVDVATTVTVMKRDKKAQAGMRLVLEGPDGVVAINVSDDDVRAALEDFVRLET